MLQPGTYFIGDLWYVLSPEPWNKVADIVQALRIGELEGSERELEIDGIQFGIALSYIDKGFCIVCGDGKKSLIPIDTGSVGCFPIEFIEDEDIELVTDVGMFVRMKEPFTIKYDEGVVRIGNNWIDTRVSTTFDDPQLYV